MLHSKGREKRNERGIGKMLILYILTFFFVIYSGIVKATYMKFNNNDIGLNTKYKFLIALLPLYLMFLHAKIAMKLYRVDKKRAKLVFVMVFTKYPVLLGCIIELILESMAECTVFGDSRFLTVKHTKVKQEKSRLIRMPSVSWDLEGIYSYFKKDSNYEKQVLNGLVC